ncbi:hypothetical protein Ae201684P_001414 [Aphanomyces euteiches]|nr:hypothetical protein Ae201684P_001414 [Aphanomyces euteiches]
MEIHQISSLRSEATSEDHLVTNPLNEPDQPDLSSTPDLTPSFLRSNEIPAPVFTPAQIEAIVTGDFVGISESVADIEDRMMPISSDIEGQIKKIRSRRKDPAHTDLVTAITKTLKRPLTRDEKIILETPDALDDPDRWLKWFETTLNTCEEARRASRDFRNTHEGRPAIVAAIKCFNTRQLRLFDSAYPDSYPTPISSISMKKPTITPLCPSVRKTASTSAYKSALRTRIRKSESASKPCLTVRFKDKAEYRYDRLQEAVSIHLSDLKGTRLSGKLWRRIRGATPAHRTLISRILKSSPSSPDPDLEPVPSNPTPTVTDPDQARDASEALVATLLDELPSDPTSLSSLGGDRAPPRPHPPDGRDLFTNPSNFPARLLCAIGPLNQAPTVAVTINGVPVSALIDTGAIISVISEECWVRAGSPTLWKSRTNMISVQGQSLQTLGLRTFTIRLAERTELFPFHVMPGTVSHCILGIDYLRRVHAQIDLIQNCLIVPGTSRPLSLIRKSDFVNPSNEHEVSISSITMANPTSTKITIKE